MNQSYWNYLWQMAFFVVVMIALNFFFHLHISIIGSLVMTVVLSLAFSFMKPK